MNWKRYNSRTGLIRMIAVGALLTHSAWAAEPMNTQKTQSSGRGIATTDLQRYQRERHVNSDLTMALQATQGQVDLAYAHCREMNQLGQQLGISGSQTPCREGGLNSNYTHDDSPDHQLDDDQNSDSVDVSPAEVILLVHGFSRNSQSNCDEYWSTQKAAFEQRDNDENVHREVLMVGYYSVTDGTCDVDLAGDNHFSNATPLNDISDALFNYLSTHHNGSYIDIVAHSMGGIVVRKMIEDWGQQLLVRNVLTLGTPHGGAQALFYFGSCELIPQCKEMSAGNDFMTTLEHNPQSVVPTQWTLIAAAYDQVVGYGTGLQMTNGNTGGPSVNTYTYELSHRHNCLDPTSAVGHADLHGEAATWTVYNCTSPFSHSGTVDNPQERIMNTIR